MSRFDDPGVAGSSVQPMDVVVSVPGLLGTGPPSRPHLTGEKLLSLDNDLYAKAIHEMHPWTLEFKLESMETLYQVAQVSRFRKIFRLSSIAAFVWFMLTATPMLFHAVESGSEATIAAMGFVYAFTLAWSLAIAGLSWLLPVPLLRRMWAIAVTVVSNVVAIPVYIMLQICVSQGVAASMGACTPEYPGLHPLMPILFAVVTPHLLLPIAGCSWYVSVFLAVEYCIVGIPCMYFAGLRTGIIWFMLAVLVANIWLTAVMSFMMERTMRTGIWLNVSNTQRSLQLAEAEAQRQEARVRNSAFVCFATASGQVLYELSASGTVLEVSGAVQDMLGLTVDTLVGKPYWSGIHEEDMAQVQSFLTEFVESRSKRTQVLQFRRIRFDSSIVWVEMVAVLEPSRDGQVVLASERDVGAEREAREAVALERQRRILATAAQSAHDETLGYACHELRNPLHVVRAALTFLNDTNLDARQKEHVTAIDAAATQMHTLVDDILDVDRLRAGKLAIVSTCTTIGELVHTTAHHYRSFARVPIVSFVAPELPLRVMIAGERVRQVLNNGITNAAKFTPRGVIQVRVVPSTARADTLRFEVRNSGVLPNRPMFRPFESSDPTAVEIGDRNSVKGTGLGLRIASAIAIALGGQLNLESQPVLHVHPDLPDDTMETVFWCELPYSLVSADSPEAAVLPAAPVLNNGTANLGLHVLYVDDEPMNRVIGQRMLRKLGCTCDVLEDGDQVLAPDFDACAFDVILLDIVMLRVHGDEVVRQLIAAGVRTPCLAVSGNTDKASVQHYFRVGFRDVLGKPFTVQQLYAFLSPYAAKV